MIDIRCTDEYILKGKIFHSNKSNRKNSILIINSATGVSMNLYKNYSIYMAENGFDTLIYDYRGIAQSRPEKLRNFKASFSEWGEIDFTSVLNYVREHFPNHKILVLGHSIGGTIIGMSEKCSLISGVINIGAQTAYYKDWDKQKYKLYFLWHILLPFITKIVGYFPGKKLNMLEDIPKEVISQWNARRKEPSMVKQLNGIGQKVYFDAYQGKLLTLGIADDVIGTPKAIERLHDLFCNADNEIEIIDPKSVGAKEIGHFGFFSRKHKNTLWQKTVMWFSATE